MLDFGFYNMDCMVGMKEFPDNYFDLAIVDPPYGINIHKKETVYGPSKTAKAPLTKYHKFLDDCIPDEKYFFELERVSKNQIIWGGNFMLDYLGKATCMIVWDKKRRGMDQADCEIAWTSLKGQSRIFEFVWNGFKQGDMKNKEIRIHPTQKPIALYKWLLSNFAEHGDKILDTHVGSASSLIACRECGFKYVGFEIDEEYYKLAQERLQAAENQMNLFDFINPYQE